MVADKTETLNGRLVANVRCTFMCVCVH